MKKYFSRTSWAKIAMFWRNYFKVFLTKKLRALEDKIVLSKYRGILKKYFYWLPSKNCDIWKKHFSRNSWLEIVYFQRNLFKPHWMKKRLPKRNDFQGPFTKIMNVRGHFFQGLLRLFFRNLLTKISFFQRKIVPYQSFWMSEEYFSKTF